MTTTRGNHCYNNVLYFFRCVFHEIIFLMIIFYCVTRRSRPAGSVATWLCVTRCRPFPAIAVLHIH